MSLHAKTTKSLKFITQVGITDKQMSICYDYFCPPEGREISLLEHIAGICQKHTIDMGELATAVGKVRVYDMMVCCSHCQVFLQVNMPPIETRSKDFPYICDSCYAFIYRDG